MAEKQKPGDEPRAKEGRRARKRELGPKQQRMVKALISADSVAEAGRLAGYGTPQSAHRALQSIRRSAHEILDEIGYGQVVALKDLKEMTQAKKTEFGYHQGVVMSATEVEDNGTRLKARIEMNKIHGHFPQGMNDSATPGSNGQAGSPQIVINLGFLDPRRAAAILAAEPAGSPAS